MTATIAIERATADDSREIAAMVGELLSEITNAIGVQAFNFDLEETTHRLEDFLDREKYFVFVAREEGGHAVGFVALYESHALYAEGTFGTIPELYVRPGYRSNHGVPAHVRSEIFRHFTGLEAPGSHYASPAAV